MEDSDPTQITTLVELAQALNALRGTRSYATLAKAAKYLPVRDRHQPTLPSSTLSDLLGGKSMPSKGTVITFLSVCGLTNKEAQGPWLSAWDRAAHSRTRRPPGAVRVREARPRLLGVHAAIQIQQDTTERPHSELPQYVQRDFDANLHTAVAFASTQGGFVLLVGGSSVGKTRALFETVKAVLPDWWLLHPADTDAVGRFAAAPYSRTVLWLDELQRYLNDRAGLHSGTVRDLVTAGVVLIATMWPDEYGTRTTPRTPGQPDPHANDRDLLGLARVLDVPDAFSIDERRRAETHSADRRIRIALDTPDAGFAQVMAAGPELVRWWEQAPDNECYGKAVITAALDSRRVGAQAPITRAYLEAAAPGYLTSAQQATAPVEWFDQALAYATHPLHGAAAPLAPIAAGMGQVAGYEAADFLHQHALRVRRTTHLPDIVWRALIEHHHPDDTMRLADNAARRGRGLLAEAFYRQGLDNGNAEAAGRLASLLFDQERIDEAIAIRRSLANNGDTKAIGTLANVLFHHGRVDEALTILRALANKADADATGELASLLVEKDRADEALAVLRPLANKGNGRVASQLAHLLFQQDRTDEALAVLRPLANKGDPNANLSLDYMLGRLGRIDELTQRIYNGDSYATCRNARSYAVCQLANVLLQQERSDQALAVLRPLADKGDPIVSSSLDGMLGRLERIDELTQRAQNGNIHAAYNLARALAKLERTDEALALLRWLVENGHFFAGSDLATLLVKLERIDELAQRSRNGDPYAVNQLITWMAARGRVDELKAELAAGAPGAAEALRQNIDA